MRHHEGKRDIVTARTRKILAHPAVHDGDCLGWNPVITFVTMEDGKSHANDAALIDTIEKSIRIQEMTGSAFNAKTTRDIAFKTVVRGPCLITLCSM